MPNWVYNGLTVTGEASEIERLVQQVGKPYETRYYNWETKQEERKMTEEGGFYFWNIVAPDESILDEYWSAANGSAPANNWYPWNNANWGTKWEACEVFLDRRDSSSVQFNFQTAWSPPYPVIEAASEQFPTLTFSLDWEEEQGFGAEVEAKAGVLVEVRSWDIPECHKDYADRDQEDRCVCAVETDPKYLFDDCPSSSTATLQEAVQKVEEASARF